MEVAPPVVTASPDQIGAWATILVVACTAGLVLWWTRHLPWPRKARAIFVVLAAAAGGFVAYTALVTMQYVPGPLQPLSWLLLAAETALLLMATTYTFYSIDAFARYEWRRASGTAPFDAAFRPKVAFHLPTFNEPPEMVVDTLARLQAMDYPDDRFEILVVDDSTEPALWKPVEAYCRDQGIGFVHRAHRRGYKSGALNVALTHTAEDVDVIAVLDADFQVAPDFLRSTVGHFCDPGLGFLQTAQDFRNGHQSFLAGLYRSAQRYFYESVLPVRNEADAIIFCGTMGLLRRSALIESGGWDEECIAEDAELSLRVLARGYSSMYVRRVFGTGLTAHTFEAFRRQQCRWAFGGVQLLRRHLKAILRGEFTARQRLDFLVGGLHWFDGVYIFVVASVMLAVAVASATGSALPTFHNQQAAILGLVTVLPFLHSLVRVYLALRKGLGLGFGQTVGVLGIWLSVKMAIAGAALRALFGGRLAFHRTPKEPEAPMRKLPAAFRAVRITPFESLMAGALAVACLANVPLALAQPGLFAMLASLAFYAAVFAQAPIFAFMSYITLVSLSPGPPLPFRGERRAGKPSPTASFRVAKPLPEPMITSAGAMPESSRPKSSRPRTAARSRDVRPSTRGDRA